MPIIAHSELPTFARLRESGDALVIDTPQPSIPALHIALINLMPDAALSATERQFCTLIARSAALCNCYIYLVSLEQAKRGDVAHTHIQAHYHSWHDIRDMPLDAIIITGANITKPDVSQEPFVPELLSIIDDIRVRHLACLFSCLAAHLLLQIYYHQARRLLNTKCWGVFAHHVATSHFLTDGINSHFTLPHSRFNDIGAEQFRVAGFTPLIISDAVGVHLAADASGRWLCMQGHPEYDAVSLLKEYKREIHTYCQGQRDNYPSTPEHYFRLQAQAICDEYQDKFMYAMQQGTAIPTLPEAALLSSVSCTWRDTACIIMGRWLSSLLRTGNTTQP